MQIHKPTLQCHSGNTHFLHVLQGYEALNKGLVINMDPINVVGFDLTLCQPSLKTTIYNYIILGLIFLD